MERIGSQLSKHVLGMKFMRKTKDELDKTRLEEKHRQHFTPELTQSISTSSASSSSSLKAIVEVVPSYAQVIGYNFGRISFGGFNPTVEYNIERGRWKAVHINSTKESRDEESEMEPHPPKRIKLEEGELEEPVYGSLIATCGKQFLQKGQRNEDNEEDVPLPDKKRGGWVQRRFISDSCNRERGKKKSRSQQPPPGKRGKFMKPSDNF